MFKRVADLVLSFAGLVIMSPVLVLIAVAILMDTGRPVFFLQERAGLLDRPFRIVKFRTMVRGADVVSFGKVVGEDSHLITKTGGFLRHWSLDELPELLNVVRGEMSLVGPRPTYVYQTASYSSEQKKRLLMKPGITGWAQVNGRNSLDWSHRIRLDVWYVEHWSCWLDLKILARTVGVVIRPSDIYGESSRRDPIVDGHLTSTIPDGGVDGCQEGKDCRGGH
jgi:undecaprenyl phosphate N,N'-diacetylbacillosamine 1-phosphate transferase